jgi:hypothetical protein
MNNKIKSHNSKSSILLNILFLLIIFSVMLIVSVDFISAIQIEMNKEFAQQETMIAKISGNFIDALGNNNILFYREHVKVPTQFTLSKISDDYYLYAVLSNKIAGNYSLQIQNAKYKIGTQIKEEDVIKNFTITNNTADFYVVPGFVKTKENFSLELTNLRDNKIEVEITPQNNSNSKETGFFESLFGTGAGFETIELSSGQTKKVEFDFDDTLLESDFKGILLESGNTSYSVPVYMEVKNKTTEKEGVGRLNFEPLVLNISIATNSSAKGIIYLKNKENLSVRNVSIYVSDSLKPYVNLSVEEIEEINENSSIRIELLISSGKDEGNFEGQLTAKYENETEELFAYSALFLSFIKDFVPAYGEENVTVVNTKTCAELNGTICNASEICSGESVYAKNEKCCLASCQFAEKSSAGKYIGWGLVAVVILFLLWFFMKHKRVRPKVDLLKIGEGKK